MKIDYVITYVNGNDPLWNEQLIEATKRTHSKSKNNSSRFRDWDTLPYLFRGIENNMPWINNVYMIVSNESQVPEWINRENVKIIYHDQIIPYKFLPTFNSNTIELYLHNIPGLSEYFLYGNDDIFPMNPSTPDMWYDKDGIPKVKVSQKLQRPYSVYTKMLKSTEILCRKIKNQMLQKNTFLRGDHNIFVMRKSMWKTIWKEYKYDLEDSITTFRNECNITPELSNFYWFMTKYIQHTRKNEYYAFSFKPISKLYEYCRSKYIINLCINDLGVKSFSEAKSHVHEALSKKFPNKSKYES